VARAHYSDVAIDQHGDFLPSAKVTVNLRASSTKASIYATEATGTPLTNPYFTSDGIVSHWADAGAYDVVIEDAAAPPAVAARTIGWSAVPGVQGGIPGSMIADASIANAKLATDAVSTPNIQSNSVTTPKILDNSITTPKIADGSITNLKNAGGRNFDIHQVTDTGIFTVDGDTDRAWSIDMSGYLEGTGVNCWIYMQLNALGGTAYFGHVHRAYATATNALVQDLLATPSYAAILCNSDWNADGFFNLRAFVGPVNHTPNPTTAKRVMIQSEAAFTPYNLAYSMRYSCTGQCLIGTGPVTQMKIGAMTQGGVLGPRLWTTRIRMRALT